MLNSPRAQAVKRAQARATQDVLDLRGVMRLFGPIVYFAHEARYEREEMRALKLGYAAYAEVAQAHGHEMTSKEIERLVGEGISPAEFDRLMGEYDLYLKAKKAPRSG
jgi:hypothetical protein